MRNTGISFSGPLVYAHFNEAIRRKTEILRKDPHRLIMQSFLATLATLQWRKRVFKGDFQELSLASVPIQPFFMQSSSLLLLEASFSKTRRTRIGVDPLPDIPHPGTRLFILLSPNQDQGLDRTDLFKQVEKSSKKSLLAEG